MLVRDFIEKALRLPEFTENLDVCRNSDGFGLVAVDLKKTYLTPANRIAMYELHFSDDAKVWKLIELINILLSADINAEINVERCEIGGNANIKWIEV